MSPILAIAMLVSMSAVSAVSGAPEIAELANLRGQSRDGVILLTDDVLSEYILGRSRPYAAAIFFSAAQVLESNPSLRLEELRKEYGYAAKAFATGPDADKLFFFEASLETSQQPFAMMQVNALPCVVRIAPGLVVTRSTVELPKGDKMLPDTVGTRNYPWPAETFVQILGTQHGISASGIDRPSLYKSPLFPLVVLAAVLAVAYAAYMVYALAILRHVAIWAVLSLAVFWFSASGGMYNIIRGVPFFMRDRNGNIQFFMTGRQGQLGAEGFALGTLYLLVSCSLSFITFLAPRIASKVMRDSLSVLSAMVAAGSLYQTFTLWTLKTGYRHVFYI